MGLFWNLLQQSQIRDQERKSETLEARVANLEQELLTTRQTLHQLVVLLEERFGQDIDGDGRVG
jgi:hypothetical protein